MLALLLKTRKKERARIVPATAVELAMAAYYTAKLRCIWAELNGSSIDDIFDCYEVVNIKQEQYVQLKDK